MTSVCVVRHLQGFRFSHPLPGHPRNFSNLFSNQFTNISRVLHYNVIKSNGYFVGLFLQFKHPIDFHGIYFGAVNVLFRLSTVNFLYNDGALNVILLKIFFLW